MRGGAIVREETELLKGFLPCYLDDMLQIWERFPVLAESSSTQEPNPVLYLINTPLRRSSEVTPQ